MSWPESILAQRPHGRRPPDQLRDDLREKSGSPTPCSVAIRQLLDAERRGTSVGIGKGEPAEVASHYTGQGDRLCRSFQ